MGDFFALDIGSSALRVVQLRGSGSNHTLLKYAVAPIDVKLSLSDAPADRAQIGTIIKQLLQEFSCFVC